MSQENSDDLKNQAKRALKSIIRVCKEIDALIPLVNMAQPPIIKYVLEKCAMILEKNVQAKKYFFVLKLPRKFAQSSALLSIQEIKALPGSKLKAAIDKINALYPSDIIEHYKPETVTALLSKIN